MSEVVNELRFLFTIMTLTIKLKLTATSLFTVTNVPIEGYLTELRCNHFSLLDKMNVFFLTLKCYVNFISVTDFLLHSLCQWSKGLENMLKITKKLHQPLIYIGK